MNLYVPGVGIGAVVSQREGESEDSPIAYFGRKLLPQEQTYSTVAKGMLCYCTRSETL